MDTRDKHTRTNQLQSKQLERPDSIYRPDYPVGTHSENVNDQPVFTVLVLAAQIQVHLGILARACMCHYKVAQRITLHDAVVARALLLLA